MGLIGFSWQENARASLAQSKSRCAGKSGASTEAATGAQGLLLR